MIALLGSWTAHTDDSRRLALAVAAAMQKRGWTRKAAAGAMGLTESHLSDKLAGREPLNLWQLSALGDDFLDALCAEIQAERGGLVLNADLVQVIRGVVQLGPRKALKLLPLLQDERKRA